MQRDQSNLRRFVPRKPGSRLARRGRLVVDSQRNTHGLLISLGKIALQVARGMLHGATAVTSCYNCNCVAKSRTGLYFWQRCAQQQQKHAALKVAEVPYYTVQVFNNLQRVAICWKNCTTTTTTKNMCFKLLGYPVTLCKSSATCNATLETLHAATGP